MNTAQKPALIQDEPTRIGGLELEAPIELIAARATVAVRCDGGDDEGNRCPNIATHIVGGIGELCNSHDGY